jgi:hypothetical protein
LEEGQACSEIELRFSQSCKEAIEAGCEIVEEREAADMRYGRNKYVADGEVQVWESGWIRVTAKFGRAKYDPRWLLEPCHIPPHQIGKPHEMILRIAGVTYYPTPKGYVQI